MDDTNQTVVNGFILIGLSDVPYLQVMFFLLFLAMYITTLLGNLLIMLAVRLNTQLQTPMYFFLSTLAFIDISLSSSIVPQIMVNTIAPGRIITVLACAAQMFISLVLGGTECLMLAVMAFDRYVAICKPLHYNIIMNKRWCIILNTGSWAICIINSTIHVALTFQLPFCRSHRVNHFFCEVPPFIRMSCKDTWLNEVGMYTSAVFIVVCSFLLTLSSYVHIISTIVKIPSSRGRLKAFSTCTSQLTVVFIYYGTIMPMYLRSRSIYFSERDRVVTILYTTVIPMVNPIIYSIRNKDVKGTIKRLLEWASLKKVSNLRFVANKFS
ncbi:olfactory receptor 1019-like [Spea bombifrons]|uniref:olfactory receptor 1019-like n=1 Tax=Spea bombifrons TaxID=233779 RepID=UPI00234BE155|nr:olfactory receptor 1019-like [Spea bombifrons]